MGKIEIILELDDKGWNGDLKQFQTAGVWALFGKKKKEIKNWDCLQVAKTINIAKEIKADKDCLVSETNLKNRKKKYINQFGNEMFSFETSPSCREFLYNKIAKEYEFLKFICISREEKAEVRTDIEMYFSWKVRPLYWRNGGTYKEDKNFSEEILKEIEKDKLKNIDENLKGKLNSTISTILNDI